ncbi:MAG: R3H domain-containing nucleic acid-binding protein [Erysipelotrichaceae bacterium]|nr:R3H domain-containing nucleic acid-binding protein [Erysipelotrichaceae bacterium]
MRRYTGKTVDEVLKNIAKEQDCKVEDITYEVIEEKKHLLGLLSSVTIEAYTQKDVKEFIFDYLGTYFTELNQEVSIEIIIEEDTYKVILDAENNAIIIGKGGQTLRAISYVLRAAVNNTFHKRFNVLVDVGNYKEDRYRKVKRIAQRVAREVRKSHVDAALDPMPNDERKVIHQFLSGMPNIKTESEGEGAHRHLVIKYVSNE